MNYKNPKKFPNLLYEDKRGYLISLNNKVIKNHWIKYEFFTYSKFKNIFRGMHFQKPPFSQKKLFIVCSGSIKTYLINITKKNFGKAYIYKLNKGDALFVPEGYANGFKTTSTNVIINYKLSNNFSANHYISFSPILFNIDIENLIISKKDKTSKINLDYLKKIKW